MSTAGWEKTLLGYCGSKRRRPLYFQYKEQTVCKNLEHKDTVTACKQLLDEDDDAFPHPWGQQQFILRREPGDGGGYDIARGVAVDGNSHLPGDWEELRDGYVYVKDQSTGNPYFHNRVTREKVEILQNSRDLKNFDGEETIEVRSLPSLGNVLDSRTRTEVAKELAEFVDSIYWKVVNANAKFDIEGGVKFHVAIQGGEVAELLGIG
jgi:hypothetical protein